MNEEDAMVWQDVLDLVAAGRTSELACPFCRNGRITVTTEGRTTRLECGACRRYIEGRLGE